MQDEWVTLYKKLFFYILGILLTVFEVVFDRCRNGLKRFSIGIFLLLDKLGGNFLPLRGKSSLKFFTNMAQLEVGLFIFSGITLPTLFSTPVVPIELVPPSLL